MKKRWQPWLRVLGIGLVVLGITAGVYVYGPTSQPKVSVKFEGFASEGTRRIAQICFTNEGNNPVWWTGDLKIIPNNGPAKKDSYRGWSWVMPASSNFVISVNVPNNCDYWHIETDFEYYKQRPIKKLFVEQYVMTGKFSPKKQAPLHNAAFSFVAWCVERLPDPKEQRYTIFSTQLTNELQRGLNSTNQNTSIPVHANE